MSTPAGTGSAPAGVVGSHRHRSLGDRLMNVLVNPLVRGLLRSPLHDLLGPGVVLVGVRGRRTGRQLTIPANAVAEGDELTLTSLRRRSWWRNLTAGAPVTVTIAGRERRGWGEVVTAGPDRLSEAVARAYERAGHPIDAEKARRLSSDRVLISVRLEPAHGPTAPLHGSALWLAWVRIVSLGEIVAFSIPAVTGALVAASEPPPVVVGGAVLAAGLAEGAVLGLAQAYVVRQALPAIPSRRWVAATAAGALIAWAVSLVPVAIGEELDRVGTGWLIAVGVPLGALGLGALGGLQWRVLREHVAHAAWWVVAVAGAWVLALAAFMAVAGPLWHENQPAWQVAAVGVSAGAVMAAVMAAMTGYALMRLLGQSRGSR